MGEFYRAYDELMAVDVNVIGVPTLLTSGSQVRVLLGPPRFPSE